jgi:hypothetical protein
MDARKPLLIVYGLCSSDATVSHAVSVNFDLGEKGIIFDGCQIKNEPSTKAFNLSEYTGDLFLPIPQQVFFFYLR